MLNNRYASQLLLDRTVIFSQIADKKNLNAMIIYYSKMTALFAAIYGVLMGFYSGGAQIFAAAFKVPLLFFGTLAICLPSLFTFNVLLGSKLCFKQTAAVSLMASYMMTLVLASLAPISLFFNVSSDNYPFIIILNVFFFAISGLFGIGLLWKSMKYLADHSVVLSTPGINVAVNSRKTENGTFIIKIWTLIYAFVGTQMAWLLRPFVGTPDFFVFFREIGGNVYLAILKNIWEIFM